MAKKISGAKTATEVGTGALRRPLSGAFPASAGQVPLANEGTAPAGTAQRAVPTKLKPSALVDTRVIYCGDNLEQPGRRQKEEGKMMKPARSPILHSTFFLLNFSVTGSFYYHCDWHASHYVKVMLDQILGENN